MAKILILIALAVLAIAVDAQTCEFHLMPKAISM